MAAFLIRRALDSLLVILVLSAVIYGLIGLMPGDPIDLMISADPYLSPEAAQRLREVYGLDRPLYERYFAWASNALAGDLGYSRLYAKPVGEVLWPRLGNTLILMGASLTLAFAIALLLGMAAATRPGGWLDGAINLTAFAGISVPPFWLAILLILLFAVTLGWLPASGMPLDWSLDETLRHLALPVLALTLGSIGALLRFVRAALIETLRDDYVRTARAKGLSAPQVLWRHALRNAMIPVVTITALSLGTLFSGALITEIMFGWLGMGLTLYEAIEGNDYNLAMAGLLLATATVLIASLVADLLYVLLDPRVGLE